MPVDSFESTTETELETEIVEISTTQVNEGVTGTTVDPCKGDTFCQVNKYNPVCGSGKKLIQIYIYPVYLLYVSIVYIFNLKLIYNSQMASVTATFANLPKHNAEHQVKL